MKKLYLFFVSLFSTCFAVANTDPVIEKAIKAQIEFSEYFIRWQNTASAYQSPNRRNGLVATYTGHDVTITVGGGHFNLMLDNITADGRQICKPVKDPLIFLHDNVIQFKHDGKFTVEYVNNDQGVRQNFIIQQPALQPQKLSVQLHAAEGWIAEKKNATSLSFKNGVQLLTYNGLKVWDAKGHHLSAHFLVVNNLVQIEVDACDAVYPVTIDPLVANSTPQNATLFLQSNRPEALMGESVSSAGDINHDHYGDVIIGVPRYSNGQPEEGAAFVYYGGPLGINPNTYTILESNIDSAQFGYTVVGAGNLNGDDYDDVVIGAPQIRVSPMAGYVGRFYVFNGSSLGIETSPNFSVDGSASNAFLGEVLSSAGDVNNDGLDDVIAGEWGTISQYGNMGRVWIYLGNPFGLSNSAPIQLEASVPYGVFGRSASGAGDVNGDGYDDILIGSVQSLGTPAGNPFKGSVRVYYGNDNGVADTPSVVLTGHTENFGYKVAAAGSVNGDPYGDIIISAPRYFPPFGDTVFIYHGASTGIHTLPDAALPAPQDTGAFGASIAGIGDLNHDNYDDIVIGSCNRSMPQYMEGMAFIHYGGPAGVHQIAGNTIQSNQVYGQLGYSVAGAGDVNNDGFKDLIVGAPIYSVGPQIREGAVFIFHGLAVSANITGTNLVAESPLEATASSSVSVSVKAFPNPVIDNLSLQFEGLDASNPTYIQVLNTQGALVQTISVGKVKSGNQQINVSKLIPGLYFIIVQNGNNTFKEKVIKQ
jgi:hypothetical protein